MAGHDADAALVRLLLETGRVDPQVLEGLQVKARAPGSPGLRVLLERRGLLPPHELAALVERAEGEQVPARPASGLPVERIGPYRLLRRLGAGGMGAVYLAQDTSSDAQVAIKLIRRAVSAHLRERFLREGQLQARVDRHPNVVRVHSAGEEEGRLYLVVELCTGGSLADRLEQGPLDVDEAVEVVAQLADGLGAVHAHGILHRDLKPANVLFDAAGRPKLVDFGLARGADLETMTKTGEMLGTLAYMAPEQARAERRNLDERTDVYQLGALAYETLTGELPFPGVGGIQLLAQILREPPPPLRGLRAEIPLGLERVVLRAMAKAPEDRFQSAAELAAALREGDTAPQRSSARPLLIGLGLVLALVGLTITALLLSRSTPDSAVAEGLSPSEAAARAAALEREAHDALAQPELDPAALDPASWRARHDELVAAWPAGAPEPEGLPAAAADVAAIEGLQALAAGDLARARRLRDQLRAKAPRRAGAIALRGAVAAVTTGTPPAQALPDLTAATAAGVVPRSLTRWSAQARLRALVALARSDPAKARSAAKAVPRDALPGDAHASARGELRRLAGARLDALESLGPGRSGAATGPLIDLLALLRWLDPKAPLDAASRERLLALCTYPQRTYSITLDVMAADLYPDDFQVQAAIARRFSFVGPTREFRLYRRRADQFRRIAQRAQGLAPTPADALAMSLLVADRYHEANRTRPAGRLAKKLLAGGDPPGLTPPQLGKLLYYRAIVSCDAKQYDRAMADLERAQKLVPSQLTIHLRRGWVLHQTNRRPEARAEFLRYLRRVDLRLRPKEARHCARAAHRLWRMTRRRGRGLAEAREALNRLLEMMPEPRYAGYALRLAHVELRAKRAPQAVSALHQAEARLARHRPMRELRRPTRAVLAQLERGERAAAKKALEALVTRLEKMRKEVREP